MYQTLFGCQGADSTVFFINITDSYEPLGFVKTPSAVTALDWSPESFVRIIISTSEMTDIVSDGALNSTHSLTHVSSFVRVVTVLRRSVLNSVAFENSLVFRTRLEP